MKKLCRIFIVAITIITLAIASESPLKAQAPYKMSVGGIVGFMNGASFKMFLGDKFAFQTDLTSKFVPTTLYGKNGYSYNDDFWSVEVNPNIVFQNRIKSWESGQFDWLVGLGLSAGYQFDNNGKAGANVIAGFEYSSNKTPIAVQLDYRPGLGILFNSHRALTFFDWALALSIRYTF